MPIQPVSNPPKIYQARIVLGNRTIQTLPTKPMPIIPPAGEDRQSVLINGFAHRFFSVPYGGIAANASMSFAYPANPDSPVITNDINIGTYIVNSTATGLTGLTDFLGTLATDDGTQAILIFPSGKSDPLGLLSPNIGAISGVRNKGIRLNCNNGGVNFTGGSGANFIWVTLTYFIYNYSTHLFETEQ
jgi:hypothetical protein